MSKDQNAQDPLEFVRGMWNQMGFSLPGMVTPTLDVDELGRIGPVLLLDYRNQDGVRVLLWTK